MNSTLKSDINMGIALFAIFLASTTNYVWISLSESDAERVSSIFISVIIVYFIAKRFVNRYYFFEDEIKIVYYFRFYNRAKTIQYNQIEHIRYVHTPGAKQPMIVLVYVGKKFSKLFLPSNSFTHRSFNERKRILKFLASKGIPIHINSVFEKDYQIFNDSNLRD